MKFLRKIFLKNYLFYIFRKLKLINYKIYYNKLQKLIFMGKIYIEYCGGWGFGGPALRLKKSIMTAFPDV